jgi:hypothetical protein
MGKTKSASKPSRKAPTTETVAASLPADLVRKVRETVGPREFSAFIASSVARELVRLRRAQFVADVVRHSGPLDPREIEKARRLICDE